MFRLRIFVGFVLILACTSMLDAQFYHCRQDTIPLSIDTLKVLVKLDQVFSPHEGETILGSIDRIIGPLDDPFVSDYFICCSLSTGADYFDFLDSIQTIEGICLVEPYYLSSCGAPLPVGEQFIVAFHTSLSTEEIDSINAENGVVMDRLIYGFESIYVLSNTDTSGMRVLDLANYYHDLSVTHFAQPEFNMKFDKHAYTLYDWYHTEQDHLKKVIGEFNQKSVWDFVGLDDTIIVAVIDDGVMSHEDLPASRILPGYDFLNNNSNAQPTGDDAHGMGCAGIIGASHSLTPPISPYIYTGMVSINPKTKIMPLKIYDPYLNPGTSNITAAINWAFINGADVVSNSWGYTYCIPSGDIDSALLRLYHDGRNGLGTPLIFSAGNDGLPGVAYPACLSYTMAVGALDLNDNRWEYSQYGSHLDLMAPSDTLCLQGNVWTLDVMGVNGWNNSIESACGMTVTWNCPMQQTNDDDYNCHFGGTSAACPLVSGIASLLISRRPDLPVDSIYKVLRYSAVTELDWGTITPRDNEYGYGRVDAFRAMLAITRGDANNDGLVNVGDAKYVINYVHVIGSPEPQPDILTGDANCDGIVNDGDAVFLINYIWRGGPKPEICFKY